MMCSRRNWVMNRKNWCIIWWNHRSDALWSNIPTYLVQYHSIPIIADVTVFDECFFSCARSLPLKMLSTFVMNASFAENDICVLFCFVLPLEVSWLPDGLDAFILCRRFLIITHDLLNIFWWRPRRSWVQSDSHQLAESVIGTETCPTSLLVDY